MPMWIGQEIQEVPWGESLTVRLPPAIRRITDPLLSDMRVPIVGGVNRGMWWSLMSSGSGYASGRRANGQMRLLSDLMHEGDVMWDVGAHHGYVSLCASRKVGARGFVNSFEPSEMNRGRLSRHVRWNHLSNVSVHGFALSNYNGQCTFGGSGTSKRNRASADGGNLGARPRVPAADVCQNRC
jgi:hypothetical protein